MDSPKLGQSVHIANSCFNALERRFQHNEHLFSEYRKFMKEYEDLNHMEQIPENEINLNKEHAYLPHHAVIKLSSSTTKVRVVFNGSSTTSSGISLNQRLIAGPKTQRDLIPILLSFRSFKIAMVADIEKMYRQILINPQDKTYQRILWRNDTSTPVKHFWLNTVTYGTTSAPFLATRALKQLTIEFENEFPLAEKAIRNNFYVDDFLGGASNEEEAAKLYNELDALLKRRGFSLRKWSSNSDTFLNSIQSNVKVDSMLIEEHCGSLKILGLKWLPKEDCFSVDVNLPEDTIATKRCILSETSKIFDPLGLISPVTITFKILLQQLWLQNYDWDDECDNVGKRWLELRNQLQYLTKLRIPRYMQGDSSKIELHGFADASELAYAAVVYSRYILENGECTVTLLVAKTRVSPIKQLSVPRLELCAATLLAKLFGFIVKNLNISIRNCIAWTDSSIVLSWLSSHPRKWKSFIANRTSMILSHIPRSQWNHVESSCNPADLASRGLTPSQLVHSNLWWLGPSWLKQDWRLYANRKSLLENCEHNIDEERRKTHLETFHIIANDDNVLNMLFSKYSKLIFIIQILSRCFQFARNCKTRKKNSNTTWIKAEDVNKAYHSIILWTQHEAFQKEIDRLKNNFTVNPSSCIAALTPFIDESGILRVGGRLNRATISYSTKHPIILPKRHSFSNLLITHLHEKHLHAGVSLLLSIIRQRYWILSCRSLVKSIINKCLTCIRHRARTSQQLMAHLPKHRVGAYRAFEHVGVDYAGPLQILNRKGRGARASKAYVVLFICFSTRAIHLELAGDLSSETFISCFKRFSSRRGLPAVIYSDNGTNFVGAHRYLKELSDIVSSINKSESISKFLSSFRIQWEFNPASAPHFGGLWEAGVKAVKSILRRVIGDTKLTYEEMYTLLAQIEGLLNSRPLVSSTDDVSSLDPLTPERT